MRRIIFLAVSLAVFGSTIVNAANSETEVKIRPSSSNVALTFDDGPDPRYTPTILSLLAQYKVHATFFVMGGEAKAHPELITAIKAGGHTIANHTYTHPMLTRLSSEKVSQELKKTNDIVFKLTGETPKCFRPPFGAVNKNIRALATKEGLGTLTWDYNSFDYEGRGANVERDWVLKAKGGAVILLHDANRGGRQTAQVLAEIIEGFQKRNIGFETICD